MAIDPGDTYLVANEVVVALESLDIDYYIGGSFASIVYGEARLTQDIDFIARMHAATVPALVRALGDNFYADEEMIREAIREESSCNVIQIEVGIKADVMFPRDDAFTRSKFARKVRKPLSGSEGARTAWFCTAEDIVLQKLRWYRMGGEVSDRQWRDIMGVLIYQAGHIDEAYLDHWASQIGVSDLLQRVR
jgi:hypothetical protein